MGHDKKKSAAPPPGPGPLPYFKVKKIGANVRKVTLYDQLNNIKNGVQRSKISTPNKYDGLTIG